MFVKIELSYPKYELIVYFYETKNVLTVNPVQTKLVLQVANGCPSAYFDYPIIRLLSL
jgi:hypothetical protein